MKILRVTVFSLWFAVSLFMVGCVALDKATGVDPKTGVVSDHPPIEAPLGILGAILSPLGFGWVSSAVLAASHVYAEVRAKNWKTAAVATAAGVQDVVGKLDAAHAQTPLIPAAVADMIKVSVDAAHDDHGVSQTIQNALTPNT